MQTQKYATRITALTLIAAIAGIFTIQAHYLFAIIIVPLVVVPKYAPIIASHGWSKLAQLTATTFCFGIVDGLAMVDILPFVQSGYEGPVPMLQIYLCILTVYHYFQFQMVNNFHHQTLSWQSFLLYHSKPYMIANTFMLIEHFLCKYVFQLWYKQGHPFVLFGLVLMVIGEGLRVGAFFTCRHNFTHLVRYKRVQGHELVTNGIYSFLRHPSYTGYFYFSVGGQIFLGNGISTILFAITLIKFFNQRIEYEQIALTSFFPEYPAYQKRTWILIPFVHGVSEDKLRMCYEFQE